ncbi:AraC family transcriptional regulator [Silvibacterium acidisoli]|uniref:AraC family transcriptional regulator n=1 Tax=Acidobacteriaceae bacterium ZG23-2 TaxID=2883246 RepID=UPI00406BFD2B
MSEDPFSDILKFTRAESLVTGGFTAGGDWAMRFPAPDKIKFFAVVKGCCWVRIDGEREPILVGSGDVGLLTAKRSFVLSSRPDLEPVDAMEIFRAGKSSTAHPGSNTAHLGEGEDFSYLGGHVLLDPMSRELLADALPPWIHVPASSPQATAFKWLLEQLVRERSSDLPGASLASGQLAQLLFIQILRAHVGASRDLPVGWLRALADARIAPALRAMHSRPEHAWGLEELAKETAMSRTSFAVSFKTAAGVSPLSYLTTWRMRLAERALRDDEVTVAELAGSLGYASESAFSNAFKRTVGVSPNRYRNVVRNTG